MVMEGTADCGALSEALIFLEHFRDLPDPRQGTIITIDAMGCQRGIAKKNRGQRG
jgi:hypothetical protein